MSKAKKIYTEQEKTHLNQRKYTRYKPDLNTLALIDFETLKDPSVFKPTVTALVTEESYKGVRLVTTADQNWNPGTTVKVKVGKLPLIEAEIRWCKKIDFNTLIYGLEYSE